MPSGPCGRSRPVRRNGALHEQKQTICQNEQQPACQNGVKAMVQVLENVGAGEGNRTLVISLEGCCSTIELHPHAKLTPYERSKAHPRRPPRPAQGFDDQAASADKPPPSAHQPKRRRREGWW